MGTTTGESKVLGGRIMIPPTLKKGGTGSEVLLLKGDLGGSS